MTNPPRALTVRHDPAARLRLFCLPHAGGGASLFQTWSSALTPGIEVCPIHLPGRESRWTEPPHTSLEALVDDLAGAVALHLDRPFALFGHSMGGTVAFELAREFRRRGLASPVRLLVSACRAPHRRSTAPPLAVLPTETFPAAVQQRYGGIPDEILQSPEWLDLLVPVLRADLTIIETYRCAEEAPLACPISVFGGSNDITLRDDELIEWRRHTAAGFDLSKLPGGHFFIKESRNALLRAIEDRL